MENQIVYMDEAEIYQCVDCGAYAKTINKIQHHESCIPGTAKLWVEFYSKEENQIENI